MIDFSKAAWISEPKEHVFENNSLRITTEPATDLWQRTYYGFRNDNAPGLLFQATGDFTFTAAVDFEYRMQYDQCGVLVYLDGDNWLKASIEYENESFSRLGSVVTNSGYSDWATTDITLPSRIWYQLNRRGPDFLIETSIDGKTYKQMRICHLHALGETTESMGIMHPPLPTNTPVRFGVYACSPLNSSFTATFSKLNLDACQWLPHHPPS